ncbi:hypothetical protein SAMN06265218_10187 [Fodinibius sediminis]|uniref:Glycosyltransferase n=2 Tax=Fodinibius sediminis TaxID=1214077 RepID=A0A521AFZ9_9BACT|nr:hypothetical protein SAMN06265218_10187 [Fodinibius sediminis]
MQDEMTGNLLMIFVKNPELGKVKTRLARSIGDKQALAVYQELLKLTQSATDSLNVTRQVWYSRFIEQEDQWKENYQKRLQRGADLGMRMKSAFQEAFDNGFEKVVIIGSDCAEMTPGLLREAFQLLEKKDVVIGPSRDGGYYLLGMANFYPGLFEDKKWSTPAVGEQTIRQLQEMQVSHALLPVRNDIDTAQDLAESTQLSYI